MPRAVPATNPTSVYSELDPLYLHHLWHLSRCWTPSQDVQQTLDHLRLIAFVRLCWDLNCIANNAEE
jgi:hypothetical protein